MPKSYKIMYGSECAGVANLVGIDTGMGIALGKFTPLPAYEEIHPVFHLFTKAIIARDAQEPYDDELKAYYRKRDELHLSVETNEGQPIPSEWINIIDPPSEASEYEIEVKLSRYSDVEKLGQEVAADKQ